MTDLEIATALLRENGRRVVPPMEIKLPKPPVSYLDSWTGRIVQIAPGNWAPWAACSPHGHIQGHVVHCRRREETFDVDLTTVSPYWNVADVYWLVPDDKSPP
jgi:hypothetical protein